jgi:hypothetical protein
MNTILTASTKAIPGPCAILYCKIKNLADEVRELKVSMASLVEENKKLDKIRGNVLDPEIQLPVIPKKNTVIRLTLLLVPWK